MSAESDAGTPALRVTISDVAAAAGVSRATATRALKGEGWFAPETQERILTAAVGLMLRDASNPAYGLLFSRLQDEAHRRGLDLITVTMSADEAGAKQVNALHRLLGMRGVVVERGVDPVGRLQTPRARDRHLVCERLQPRDNLLRSAAFSALMRDNFAVTSGPGADEARTTRRVATL